MPTLLFFGIFFGCPTLMLILVIMGCVELVTTRRLRKHGQSIEGQIEDVDLKSSPRPVGVYGKVRFTYHVNERTYTKKQTVDKDTAMALLSGLPAFPLLSEPTKVTILFLLKKPTLARLAIAPSDRMRMVNCVVALIVLGFIAALILVGVLLDINRYPNY